MDIKLQIFGYPTHVSRETHPMSRIIRTLIVYFSTRAAKHQYAFPSLCEGFANNFTCKRVSYVLFVRGFCIFHIFKQIRNEQNYWYFECVPSNLGTSDHYR